MQRRKEGYRDRSKKMIRDGLGKRPRSRNRESKIKLDLKMKLGRGENKSNSLFRLFKQYVARNL